MSLQVCSPITNHQSQFLSDSLSVLDEDQESDGVESEEDEEDAGHGAEGAPEVTGAPALADVDLRSDQVRDRAERAPARAGRHSVKKSLIPVRRRGGRGEQQRRRHVRDELRQERAGKKHTDRAVSEDLLRIEELVDSSALEPRDPEEEQRENEDEREVGIEDPPAETRCSS